MKQLAFVTLASVAAVLLTACSSEYLISTSNGNTIATSNKPMLNQRTGMVQYQDEAGHEAEIRQSDVNSIIER